MRKNEKSQKTKADILNSAKTLYYDNGFLETSFEEIAQNSGITRPLISHYFTSKNSLGGQIFGNYSKENANVFFEKVYSAGYSDKTVAMAAFSIQCIKYYKEDPRAFRFFSQYFSSCGFDLTPEIEDFWIISSHSNESDFTDTGHMDYICSQFSGRALIYHYVNGEIKCKPEEVYKYQLSLQPNVNSSDPGFGRLFETVMALSEKINIEYGPYFVWK